MSACCDEHAVVRRSVIAGDALHARTALALARVAQGFGAAAELAWGGRTASATSLTALLSLQVPAGAQVDITTRGAEAEAAAEALAELLATPARAAVYPVAVLSPGAAVAGAWLGEGAPRRVGPGERHMLVAAAVTAEQLLSWPREALAGVVVMTGGPTSHAAIVARSLGVPMVSGLPEEALALLEQGRHVAIDGAQALVCLRAGAAGMPCAAAEEVQAAPALEQATVTPQGASPALMAEAASPDEVARAVALGAYGIGLVRTEFDLLAVGRPLSAAEQRERYGALLGAAQGHPVVFRAYDLALDKLPRALAATLAPGSEGLRGSALALLSGDLLDVQLRVLARMDEQGPSVVLMPYIRSLDEWRSARERWRLAGGDASRLGLMAETPAVALDLDPYLPAAQVSVGTSDLLASFFGLSREQASPALEDLLLHPAWLRMLRGVVLAARRRGVGSSMCGAMAASPQGAVLLAGMGVDAITAPLDALAAVRAALLAAAGVDLAALCESCCSAQSTEEVKSLVESASGAVRPPSKGPR